MPRISVVQVHMFYIYVYFLTRLQYTRNNSLNRSYDVKYRWVEIPLYLIVNLILKTTTSIHGAYEMALIKKLKSKLKELADIPTKHEKLAGSKWKDSVSLTVVFRLQHALGNLIYQ